MSNRIRELREKRGMNQEALAGFIGVSQQTISKVERNTDALGVDLLIEISDFFSVTTDYDLIVEFEELNENNKKVVQVMIRALKEAQTDGELR